MAGVSNISYNYFNGGFDTYLSNITNDGTNQVAQTFTIDGTTGAPLTGTYQDLGNPALIYTDHDLTRNDLGCFGGSNSMDNYFTTGGTDNNRVYFLNMPRSIYTGRTIKVKAEGFDK